MMDNELDQRLKRLEAGQKQLLSGQEHIQQELLGLALQLQQPDEEGEKLHEVLAQLTALIGSNAAVLNDIKNAVIQRHETST